jgi:NADP-dependent 3-hydroxy acid dehydrogenase YdfG
MWTVLVTGATAGFGDAIARRYHASGATVYAAGRRADRLRALAADLGPRLVPLPFDVRDADASREAIASLPAALDALVNNAGLALGIEPAQRADLDDWQTMIDTNCTALARITHLVLPGMVALGRGHVVNVSSVAAHYAYPGGNVYGATKAFVSQFSKNLRSDLLGTGVRVTCVEPGAAETEFSLVRFKGDSERAAQPYKGMTPLAAIDVAEAVFWATSQPAHVNVSVIELMPTVQASAGLAVHRTP